MTLRGECSAIFCVLCAMQHYVIFCSGCIGVHFDNGACAMMLFIPFFLIYSSKFLFCSVWSFFGIFKFYCFFILFRQRLLAECFISALPKLFVSNDSKWYISAIHFVVMKSFVQKRKKNRSNETKRKLNTFAKHMHLSFCI